MPRHGRLADGAFFCGFAESGVVLDVRSNRYVGLSKLSARILAELEAGRGPDEVAERLGTVLQEPLSERLEVVDEQIAVLTRAGLWTVTEGESLQLRAKSRGAPGTSGADRARVDQTPLSGWELVTLTTTAARVRSRLRSRGLVALIRRMQAHEATLGWSDEPVYRALRAYTASRRLLSQGAPDCLERSLALATHLRSRGLDAELCFGVASPPFVAHAWVELSGKVVNDFPSNLRRYQVIARF
jgi:hypothetical protein